MHKRHVIYFAVFDLYSEKPTIVFVLKTSSDDRKRLIVIRIFNQFTEKLFIAIRNNHLYLKKGDTKSFENVFPSLT